jgi:hypothetical protein
MAGLYYEVTSRDQSDWHAVKRLGGQLKRLLDATMAPKHPLITFRRQLDFCAARLIPRVS